MENKNLTENILKKYTKVNPIVMIQPDIKKEIYLDNYYSKDFLKKYFFK